MEKAQRIIETGVVGANLTAFMRMDYAFDKTKVHKRKSRNHLVDQVESFRIGDKDNKREDDLLDRFCCGIAIGRETAKASESIDKGRQSSIALDGHFRKAPVVLQKSFCGPGLEFCEPQARRSTKNVGNIADRISNHGSTSQLARSAIAEERRYTDPDAGIATRIYRAYCLSDPRADRRIARPQEDRQ